MVENEHCHSDAMEQLRATLNRVKDETEFRAMIDAKQTVLDKFQPVFSSNSLPNLTEGQFKSFLSFENNRHWSNLQRQQGIICKDIPALQKALLILTDESKPIGSRLDKLITKDKGTLVRGLNRAILTAILQVTYPDKHGVWNRTSEEGMKRFGLMPEFKRGEGFGSKYTKVDSVLNQTSAALGIDLWTLDALWWKATGTSTTEVSEISTDGRDEVKVPGADQAFQFSLEKQLHEFIVDNWDNLELSKNWTLCEEDGEIVGYGYKRKTDIGEIDLLAKAKSAKGWLVIELKRDQTEDATVGQVLRYMGWVKKNLASSEETVRGMIVCGQSDDNKKLQSALSIVPSVELWYYAVDFHLKKADPQNW